MIQNRKKKKKKNPCLCVGFLLLIEENYLYYNVFL